MKLAILFSQLGMLFALQGDTGIRAIAPALDDVLLDSREYFHRNDRRALELRAVRERLPDGSAGNRFRFHLVNIKRAADRNNAATRETVSELPDIPTHDVLGAPPIVRGGAILIQWESRVVYVVTGKSIGRNVILRVHEILIKEAEDGAPSFELHGLEPLAQTSAALANDDEPVLRVRAEMDNGNLKIGASRTRGNEAGLQFRLNVETKSLVRSSDVP